VVAPYHREEGILETALRLVEVELPLKELMQQVQQLVGKDRILEVTNLEVLA